MTIICQGVSQQEEEEEEAELDGMSHCKWRPEGLELFLLLLLFVVLSCVWPRKAKGDSHTANCSLHCYYSPIKMCQIIFDLPFTVMGNLNGKLNSKLRFPGYHCTVHREPPSTFALQYSIYISKVFFIILPNLISSSSSSSAFQFNSRGVCSFSFSSRAAHKPNQNECTWGWLA